MNRQLLVKMEKRLIKYLDMYNKPNTLKNMTLRWYHLTTFQKLFQSNGAIGEWEKYLKNIPDYFRKELLQSLTKLLDPILLKIIKYGTNWIEKYFCSILHFITKENSRVYNARKAAFQEPIQEEWEQLLKNLAPCVKIIFGCLKCIELEYYLYEEFNDHEEEYEYAVDNWIELKK